MLVNWLRYERQQETRSSLARRRQQNDRPKAKPVKPAEESHQDYGKVSKDFPPLLAKKKAADIRVD